MVRKYNHHANHGSVPEDKANLIKRDFGTETITKSGVQISPTSMCRKTVGMLLDMWVEEELKPSSLS